MGLQSTSKLFPGFNHIYWLYETGSPFRGEMVRVGDNETVYTRCEARPDKPVEIRWVMGRKKPGDLIKTTLVVPIIVSQRVINVLQENHFNGWDTYDVRVFDKSGDLQPGYFGLSIYGRCGPIDNSKSTQVPKKYPAGVFPVWKGLYFNPETWDGTDLFMTSGESNWIFAVENVVKAFKKSNIRGFAFFPLDNYERTAL